MEAIGGCKEKSNMNPPLQGVHALASLKRPNTTGRAKDVHPSRGVHWPSPRQGPLCLMCTPPNGTERCPKIRLQIAFTTAPPDTSNASWRSTR